MTNRGPFLFLIALLILTGVTIATYRQQTYRIPIMPGAQQSLWQIEARIRFVGEGVPSEVLLTLPPNQNGFRIVNETGASSGFGYTPPGDEPPRQAVWTRRNTLGEQILYYKLDLIDDPGHRVDETPPGEVDKPIWSEPYRTAAEQIMTAVMPITADANSLTRQLIRTMSTEPLDQNASLLLDHFDKPTLLAHLLQTAGVPARTVQVLALEDGRRRQSLDAYVQVWHNDRWRLYDPNRGLLNAQQNRHLLLWQTDTPGVLEVQGGHSSRISFSMISQLRSSLALAKEEPSALDFSLYSLPIAEQGIFKLIMLLPIGALVVVFMRVLVGMRTSGTFMPVLIALAFLQTDLLPGLASFLIVVAIGLVFRSYLSALNLLLVARIATLVILVIGIISVFSVISYRLGLIGGLTITFFPMVILAWTIERMSILWEEEGAREVAIQGGGSLLVAVLAYLVMEQSWVAHMAFNFPELHLVVLALIMVLGRYTGYRLLELHRFAALKTP